jgi:E3 ubiquitin-protein ligase HERC4
LGLDKNVSYIIDPIQINNNIDDISCGLYHNIILKRGGDAFGFGDNSFGQLGILNTKETYIQSIININDIVQIATGDYHSLLLNNNNQIFSFGSNSFGQLGLNIEFGLNVETPTQIIFPNNLITQISCGKYHCLVLCDSGDVYSFGLNNVFFY